MGLDIGFNKAAAVEAGMTFFNSRNGSAQEIEDAVDRGCDEGFINWLREAVVVINVPNAPLSVVVSEYDGKWSCRANQWGRVYDPLTQWLKANKIQWSEF